MDKLQLYLLKKISYGFSKAEKEDLAEQLGHKVDWVYKVSRGELRLSREERNRLFKVLNDLNILQEDMPEGIKVVRESDTKRPLDEIKAELIRYYPNHVVMKKGDFYTMEEVSLLLIDTTRSLLTKRNLLWEKNL